MTKFYLALYICLLSFSAFSNDSEFPELRPQKNLGCNEKELVDTSEALLEAFSFFTGKVNWTPVCARHDVCYATLGADQNNCDTTFYDHLKGECRNAYPKNYKVVLSGGTNLVARELCYDVANLMYRSVKNLGKPNFDKAKTGTKELFSTYPSRIYPSTNFVPFLSEYPYMMEWYARGVFDVVYARLGKIPTDLELYQELEFRFTGKRTEPYSQAALISIFVSGLN